MVVCAMQLDIVWINYNSLQCGLYVVGAVRGYILLLYLCVYVFVFVYTMLEIAEIWNQQMLPLILNGVSAICTGWKKETHFPTYQYLLDMIHTPAYESFSDLLEIRIKLDTRIYSIYTFSSILNLVVMGNQWSIPRLECNVFVLSMDGPMHRYIYKCIRGS